VDCDALADLERHQILANFERAGITLSCFGDQIIEGRFGDPLAAQQDDMRIGRELRLDLANTTPASFGVV
jgi:hypothetical protein